MSKQDEVKQKEEEKNEHIEEGEIDQAVKGGHDECQRKLEEVEGNYRRALADYQNLQKRVALERQDWIKIANRELLLRLLPVLDTLILASKHVDDKGLNVSISLFMDTLKSEGVTKIKTEGEKFDPETMECIQTEDGEEGRVLEELRAGYTIHEKLLRPAQVKVGQESIKR